MYKDLQELIKEYERDIDSLDRDSLLSLIDDMIPQIKELQEENERLSTELMMCR
jgi:hypothetical protein